MKTFKIKPKNKHLQVIDPETMKPLKEEGEQKPRTEYWLRRVIDGDVVIARTTTKATIKEKE